MSRWIFHLLSLNCFLFLAMARFPAQNGAVSPPCPLSFSTLRTLNQKAKEKPSKDVAMNCQYSSQGLRLVLSEYLHSTGSFYPPPDSAESCWNSYESLVESIIPGFNVRSSCGFQTSWITRGCMNISTRSEFERLVPRSALADVVSNCNQSLEDQAPCTACLGSLNAIQASYLQGPSTGNISDCSNLPSIYAAAVINSLGPDDPRASNCLFCLYFTSKKTSHSRRKLLLLLILVVILVGSGSIFGGYFVFRRKRKSNKHKRMPGPVGSAAGSALISWNFTFEQIKEATNNFHRDNLIGRGGFGNVYKATLPDGSEFAVKRFKNCSAVGDAEFSHEVESLASIRHINLVELRGYCVASTVLEGHQRFIVCDLMENGNLHDHLFGGKTKLSWPTRQKITLGIARGLAYLHYGAQPPIIHRDVKASNILLDEGFDAKVADFGLAKVYPEGKSHLSTKVAGTMGYVAPEYAVYGQLTERSDVYSFGVVLLELLSGKKAILSMNEEGQPSLLTDWVWSLVTNGDVSDVIEQGMPEPGPEQVMDKYVFIAVLCAHPQLHARPTMDQVVKILETDLAVPWIPKGPLAFDKLDDDIERPSSPADHTNTSDSHIDP